MDQKSFRPLAPYPPGDTSRPEVKPARRTNISLACSACRAHKSKCDGGQPCTSCVKRGAHCVYDENADQRRGVSVKRKIEDLEAHHDFLMRLLGTLRDSGDARALSIINLVRSDAPLHELKLYIDEQVRERKSPELIEVRDQVSSMQETRNKVPRRVLGVKNLADQPPIRVPAKPWTTVTDDEVFVSHLISLYFTWYHPCFPWIDRDLFIRDMEAGRRDSQYCSPFLVNTILADACAYSDYAEAYKDQNDLSTRGLHFYEEAKKCLESEEEHFTLATVQGLCVLSVCAFLMGKDRVGWLYQGQLAFAVRELAMRHRAPSSDATADAQALGRAAKSAFWGLYCITMASGMAYHRSPIMEPPRGPPPQCDHDDVGDLWYPYPLQGDSYRWHSTCHFNRLCNLTMIISDWCLSLFGDKRKPPSEKVMNMTREVHRRLSEWERGLPSCLTVDAKDNTLFPQVLCLHMYYHNIIITIFGFAKTARDEATDQASIPSDHTTNMCLSSARRVSYLMDLHRASWGIDIFPASHIQWITVSLFTLLEGLDEPANREAFISLSIAAKAASRRWILAKGMLRTIQLTARQMAVTLPTETEALFTDFERDDWNSSYRQGLSSMYPNFAVSTGSVQGEEVDLDKFLAKWDALDISGQEKAKSGTGS